MKISIFYGSSESGKTRKAMDIYNNTPEDKRFKMNCSLRDFDRNKLRSNCNKDIALCLLDDVNIWQFDNVLSILNELHADLHVIITIDFSLDYDSDIEFIRFTAQNNF